MQMPQIKIVGFSVHSSPAVLNTMMQAGASGFVTKARAYEELIEAAKKVLAGGLYISTFTGQK
jgi:DNA-binding NarL/FixJ family response regulator